MRFSRVAIGLLVLVLVLVLAVVHGLRGAASPPQEGTPKGALVLDWPEGRRTRYAFTWDAHTKAALVPTGTVAAAEKLDARTHAVGELTFEALGREGGEAVVALSFASLAEFDVNLQGVSALERAPAAKDEYLRGKAFLRITPRGGVRAISFSDESAPALRQALRAVALQVSWTLPPGPEERWIADERVAAGVLRWDYAREDGAIVRRPATFVSLDSERGAPDGTQRLSGEARLELDADGALVELEETDDWAYTRRTSDQPTLEATIAFHLTRKGSEAFDPAALRARALALAAVPTTTAVDDAGLAARRDARLAARLTTEQVLAAVDEFELGRRPANDFVVRAGAFLRLHPEAIAALHEAFLLERLTRTGRSLVLDLLVEAGDPRSQAALGELLSLPLARVDDGTFGVFLQRFTFVRKPTADSVAWVEHERREALREGRDGAARGTAAALGAMAAHLARDGDGAAADRVVAKLAGELDGTRDPELRAALITGLGNAQRPSTFERVEDAAFDDEAAVREAAARALRGYDSPRARETLLVLASDGDSGVAQAALGALGRQTLADTDWHALRRLVEEGRLNQSADNAVVSLVSARDRVNEADGRAILQGLLARNDSPDNDLGELIRRLVGTPE